MPARRLWRRVLAVRPSRPVALCVRAAGEKKPCIGVRGCPSSYIGVFGSVLMTTSEYFPSLASLEGRLGSVRYDVRNLQSTPYLHPTPAGERSVGARPYGRQAGAGTCGEISSPIAFVFRGKAL